MANQSLNVAINHSNANKSTPLSYGKLLQSYLLAVGASCSVAVGLNSLVPRLRSLSPQTRLILGRLVPFAAVASAGALNVFLMRGEEMRAGIDVYPVAAPRDARQQQQQQQLADAKGSTVADGDDGSGPPKSLGKSRRAAAIAVGETALSRVLNSSPIMVLPPLVLVRLQATDWLRRNPRYTLPINLALILATSYLALPLALGAFPQRQRVAADSLEDEFHGRGGVGGMVVFNRGI